MLTQPTILEGSPTAQLLALRQAVRDGAPLVVMTADPRLDGALGAEPEAPRAALAEALAEGTTRVVGPCAGGWIEDNGSIGLLSAVGTGFKGLVTAIGPATMRRAIDLGLGWDLAAAEVLADLGRDPDLRALGLAGVPEGQAGYPFAATLAEVAARIPVIALAPASDAAAWEVFGVQTIASTAAFGRALRDARRVERRTGGDRSGTPRVAIVTRSAALGALARRAVGTWSSGAALAPETVTRIASEVHRRAQLGDVVDLTGLGTPRHIEVAIQALSADVNVDHIWVLGGPPAPTGRVSWTAEDDDVMAAGAALRAALMPLPARSAHAGLANVPTPGLERAQALIAATLLMRRTHLDRNAALDVLQAAGAGKKAPAILVSGLAMARDAAQRLGYPIVLGTDATPVGGAHVTTAEALATAWQALEVELAALGGEAPFAPRYVVAVPPDARSVRVTLGSNLVGPVASWDGVPSPVAPLAAGTAPHALARGLAALAEHLPEIATLTLVAAETATGFSLIDARARLTSLPEALDPRR